MRTQITSLPPHLRVLKSNILLVGMIPGPEMPKEISSFLQPLMEELAMLQDGTCPIASI